MASISPTGIAKGRFVSPVVVCLSIAMLVPPGFVVLQSFSADDYLQFPPDSWGLTQYKGLFVSGYWGSSIVESVRVAAVASSVAVVLGVTAGLGLTRSALSLTIKSFGRLFLFLPIMLPLVSYAVALYSFFGGFGMVGNWLLLGVVHGILATPLALIVIITGIERVSDELELAAMSLGAGRLRAFMATTFAMVLPNIATGAAIAFVFSFDEAVMSSFLAGPDLRTLPKAMLDQIRIGQDPIISAIAAILIVISAAAVAILMDPRRQKG